MDAIVAATSPTVAFKIGEKAQDPLAMYLSDVLTIPANMAGIPGISLTCGFKDGLPIALQVLGPALGEEICFASPMPTSRRPRGRTASRTSDDAEWPC